MKNNDTALVAHAAAFAYKAHAKQTRKYTELPYFTHVYDVAKLVEAVGVSSAGIAAAFLHDVLEDTPTTTQQLRQEFGTTLTEIVQDLTDRYTASAFPHLNRQKRKKWEADRLRLLHPTTQTVKLADLIDNAMSIVNNDPEFARIYLAEKELYLESLSKGHPHLIKLAKDVLRKSKEQLGMV